MAGFLVLTRKPVDEGCYGPCALSDDQSAGERDERGVVLRFAEDISELKGYISIFAGIRVAPSIER